MMPIDKAKPLRDYNAIIISRFNEICEPLNILGISNFAYMKITKDKRYFRIGNHEKYTDLFFGLNLYDGDDFYRQLATDDSFKKPTQLKSSLWSPSSLHNGGNIRLSAGMWNGITFTRNTQDYVEGWSFGGTPEDTHLLDFYFNNMDLLSKFINYFKSVGQDILDISDRSKTIDILFHEHPSIFDNLTSEKILAFNAKILAKKYQVIGNQGDFNLTQKEIECLIHKSQGLTAKEIAKIWAISPRTVESHIKNIKMKSGLDNIHQVIYKCKDSGLL